VLAGGPGSGRHKQFYGQKPKIAIDFDGVLHQYSGYSKTLGKPIPGALAGIKALQKANMQVVVHSVRPAEMIKPWLKQHGFPDLEVTNKKPIARAYLDDRAVNFGGKWDAGLVKRLVGFQPNWEKDATTRIHASDVNWTSPSGPVGQDWFEVAIGICPIPHDHAPSLKNPIITKIPTAQDGFHKNDSKAAKAQAMKDLIEIHRHLRRQYGKPEIARTADFPLYPSFGNWT
jgi:hypothetical protein